MAKLGYAVRRRHLFLGFYKEKRNVIGNYSINHSGVDADRRDPNLATQQIVGLWPERRAWAGIDHSGHSVAAGTIVMMIGYVLQRTELC